MKNAAQLNVKSPINIRLLGLCGSLRKFSTNRSLLHAFQLLAPDDIDVDLYDGLAALPAFNPDLDSDDLPPAVVELRTRVGLCDGLLISSPEYARGIAGSMKNALDWLVSSAEFPGIAVAVLNASPRSTVADTAIRLVLETMSATIIEPASIALPLSACGQDTASIMNNVQFSEAIRIALRAMPRRERVDYLK